MLAQRSDLTLSQQIVERGAVHIAANTSFRTSMGPPREEIAPQCVIAFVRQKASHKKCLLRKTSPLEFLVNVELALDNVGLYQWRAGENVNGPF
ncbi:hypothetical protein BSZ35_18615 [Salinibacter sp. 10B]|nr:hypothetical protein BSZ35_18615 [Salinibacter sp. 10B]